MSRTPRRLLTVAAASALLALTGCGDDGGPSPQPAASPPLPEFAPAGQVACSEEAYTAAAPEGAWEHPSQNFYAPGEQALPSQNDLEHLLAADSAVVVRYRPDAPPDQRETLRTFAGSVSAIVVLPGATRDDVALEAFTVNRRLICDGVDTAQLTTFADRRGSSQGGSHGDGMD